MSLSEATYPADVILPRDHVFDRWAAATIERADGLRWVGARGMGALRVTPLPYDESYFANYEVRARTPMGVQITAGRVDLVRRFYGSGHVVDVGIGCGAFVQARLGWTWGYDVNPAGVEWLRRRARWRDPYESPVSCVTLWDVLEHIPEPARLLGNVTGWIFASCPIWRGSDEGPDASWRHFKPAEHCWYWTREGLIAWMREHGFVCRYADWDETYLGRLDIGTFAFQREPAR